MQNVILNGSASTDPEGSALSYSWESGGVFLGSGVTLTVANVPQGDYTVTLTVTDNAGNPDTDDVEIHVVADGGSGGGAVTVDFENLTVGTIASGIYTDPSGYVFSDIGYVPALGGQGSYNLEVWGPAQGYDSIVIENPSWDRTIRVDKGGAVFDLTSFQFAGGLWGGNPTIHVTGFHHDGTTTLITLIANSYQSDTETVNWTNLDKVEFQFVGGYGALDNFTF